MDVVQVFTLELNCMPLPGSIMHKMCRYTLYAETTLHSNNHHLYLNSADWKGRDTGNNKMEQRSQELYWDMHKLCMHFHSLPSARVISVGPVFDPQNQVASSVWQEWSERQGTLCGQCQHGVRARIPRAFRCWWPPSSDRWFSVSSSTSLQASMVSALVTHWTNGYCAHHRLRADARWLHTCILQVMCIEPSAGCLSCEHSFPPLAYKAPTSWWSLIKTKELISGGGNFFGTMRKKICPWRLCQTV